MYKTNYLELYKTNKMLERVKEAENILYRCKLCPHECGVNRIAGELGVCKAGALPLISSAFTHFGEENVLVGRGGSGTIFFARCSLKCVYCQNNELSQPQENDFNKKYERSIEQLVDAMLYLQNSGSSNINFVSPTHFVPQILHAIYIASDKGLNIPLVYNSSAYDSVNTIKLLDGIIDIYLPDFKYSDKDIAYKYSKVKNYVDSAKSAIKEMDSQVGGLQTDHRNNAVKGLIIRHLILPDNKAGSEKILNFIANELSEGVALNIMDQYHPDFKASNYPEINRRITGEEYKRVVKKAKELNIKLI